MSWLNLEVTCEGIRPLLVRGTASGIAQWALGVEVTVVLFVVVFRGRRRCRRRRCPRRRCVGRRRRGGPCPPVTAPHPTHPLARFGGRGRSTSTTSSMAGRGTGAARKSTFAEGCVLRPLCCCSWWLSHGGYLRGVPCP